MNRYSFSGKGNILLKAGSTGVYGSSSFSTGEPIAYFTDVNIDVIFSGIDKIARTGTSNLTADSKAEPSMLRISGIKSTDSLQSLLYKKKENQTKNKTIIKSLTSNLGSMYLPIQGDEVLVGDLFIYNNLKEKMTQYTLEPLGKIIGLPNGQYTVFYSINSESISTFSLETPQTPNMQAQIVIDGNVNGQTGQLVLNLNAIKLLTEPTMNFNIESPFVDNLEFVILNTKDPVEVNYYA